MITAVALVAATGVALPGPVVLGVVAFLKTDDGMQLLADITNRDGYMVFTNVPLPFVGRLRMTCGVELYDEAISITEGENITIRVGVSSSPANPQDVLLPACVPSFA